MLPIFLLLLGLFTGALSSIFGIGGGMITIPVLVFLFGFTQKMAVGTTLGMMLPPIGILAFLEYYKNGHVNLQAVALIVVGFLIGSYFMAKIAVTWDDFLLKKIFGVFIIFIGILFLFKK